MSDRDHADRSTFPSSGVVSFSVLLSSLSSFLVLASFLFGWFALLGKLRSYSSLLMKQQRERKRERERIQSCVPDVMSILIYGRRNKGILFVCVWRVAFVFVFFCAARAAK